MAMDLVSLTSKIGKDDKNILTNIGFSLVVKGGSLIVTVLTIPSYMRFFDNKSVLGVWFTILSVLSWILTFDFGVGNGLRNQLVPALVENDTNKQRSLISSAYISLAVISFGIFAILFIAANQINWNGVFNISQKTVSTRLLTDTVMIGLLSIVLQFSLRLITSILYALQYSFLPSLLSFLSSAFLLTIVNLSIVYNHKNDFIFLAWGNLFCVNIPLIIATIAIFSTKMKNVCPSGYYFNIKLAIGIYKYGFVFLWLQFMALIINNTNDFLISFLVGPSQDVPYQAYSKIFTLVSGLAILTLTPIWSAVTKAKAEKRNSWIKKVYLILLLLIVVSFVLYLTMLPFLQIVFNIWLGTNTIRVNYAVAFAFVLYGTMSIWNGVVCTFVNGLGELRIQLIFLTFGAVINIPLSYLFVHIQNSFASIVAANVVSLLPFCIIQTLVLLYKLEITPHKKSEGQPNANIKENNQKQ